MHIMNLISSLSKFIFKKKIFIIFSVSPSREVEEIYLSYGTSANDSGIWNNSSVDVIEVYLR